MSVLAPEELQSLLLLLSCLSPDGRLSPTTFQLSKALGLSPAKTRARFERLCAVSWLDQRIVAVTKWGNGLDGFTLIPGFMPVVEESKDEFQQPRIIQTLPHEAIIEHSRRAYAKTREEVEREIAEMMDWRKDKRAIDTPSEPVLSPEQAQMRADLLAVGLLLEQADDLMNRYDALRIRRQLAWLPFRGAKNEAGYLLAAVRDDYAKPRGLTPPVAQKGDDGE